MSLKTIFLAPIFYCQLLPVEDFIDTETLSRDQCGNKVNRHLDKLIVLAKIKEDRGTCH